MIHEREDYLDKLIESVELDDKTEQFSYLLEYLDTVNYGHFIWSKLDEDRVQKGKKIREEYAELYLNGRQKDKFLSAMEEEFEGGISFLEFLISLAKSMSETMYFDNHLADFFWPIIDNLGLNCMTNDEFDCDVVDSVLVVLKDRSYERDGSGGGLFYVPNAKFDMRKIDYLQQANLWLSYNFVRF